MPTQSRSRALWRAAAPFPERETSCAGGQARLARKKAAPPAVPVHGGDGVAPVNKA